MAFHPTFKRKQKVGMYEKKKKKEKKKSSSCEKCVLNSCYKLSLFKYI